MMSIWRGCKAVRPEKPKARPARQLVSRPSTRIKPDLHGEIDLAKEPLAGRICPREALPNDEGDFAFKTEQFTTGRAFHAAVRQSQR